jgi:hypothetical protein
MLYRWNSRIVAAILLTLIIVGQGWRMSQGQRYGALDGMAAMLGLWAGIRATQATFKLHARKNSKKDYDVKKWEALVKYDEDISLVAQKLAPYGQQWIDEFARAYLALNDKRYIVHIVKKIVAEANKETGAKPR